MHELSNERLYARRIRSTFSVHGQHGPPLVEEIAKAVRKCLHRPDLTPERIHHFAVLLFGLERLPLATKGLTADLILSYRSENAMSYVSIRLDPGSFCLATGGSIYTPGAGGENYGDDVLRVEIGGYREAQESAFAGWLGEFKSRLEDADIRIDLDDGCDIDWNDEPDVSAWERAAKQFDSDDSEDVE